MCGPSDSCPLAKVGRDSVSTPQKRAAASAAHARSAWAPVVTWWMRSRPRRSKGSSSAICSLPGMGWWVCMGAFCAMWTKSVRRARQGRVVRVVGAEHGNLVAPPALGQVESLVGAVQQFAQVAVGGVVGAQAHAGGDAVALPGAVGQLQRADGVENRSEEHTSEL